MITTKQNSFLRFIYLSFVFVDVTRRVERTNCRIVLNKSFVKDTRAVRRSCAWNVPKCERLVTIAAYREMRVSQSLIKRVAMLAVKSGETTRARIDQITIGRHVERHGARAISVSNGRPGDNQSCRFVVNCQ